ncbi:hypothetical protein XENOCAPTIV_019989, partial [Xenoophorus captivus]
ISEVDFMDSVLALGFGEALIQSLLQLYLQHKHQIRSILSQLTYHQPAYHNLEWRLDVQVRVFGVIGWINGITCYMFNMFVIFFFVPSLYRKLSKASLSHE